MQPTFILSLFIIMINEYLLLTRRFTERYRNKYLISPLPHPFLPPPLAQGHQSPWGQSSLWGCLATTWAGDEEACSWDTVWASLDPIQEISDMLALVWTCVFWRCHLRWKVHSHPSRCAYADISTWRRCRLLPGYRGLCLHPCFYSEEHLGPRESTLVLPALQIDP